MVSLKIKNDKLVSCAFVRNFSFIEKKSKD